MKQIKRNFWRLEGKLIRLIKGHFYLDLDKNIKNTILLVGSGRSGTTWFSNLINYNNEYRYMFEPFNKDKVRLQYVMFKHPYINENNKSKKLINLVKNILSGKIRNNWIDSYNKKLFAKKRLIKDIRINLFLKWIKNNFPSVPIILVLRNPFAVVNSKMKLNWDNHLDEFLQQKELINDFLKNYVEIIENAEDEFDKHVIQWCIENYVPLKQFKQKNICIVFYENMIINPKKELNKIFKFLSKKYNKKIFNALKKPSSLSRKDSAIIKGGDLINSWKRGISKKQIRKANKILKKFGMDKIYNQKSLPVEKELNKFMKSYKK